jgi:hypothetical protein
MTSHFCDVLDCQIDRGAYWIIAATLLHITCAILVGLLLHDYPGSLNVDPYSQPYGDYDQDIYEPGATIVTEVNLPTIGIAPSAAVATTTAQTLPHEYEMSPWPNKGSAEPSYLTTASSVPLTSDVVDRIPTQHVDAI